MANNMGLQFQTENQRRSALDDVRHCAIKHAMRPAIACSRSAFWHGLRLALLLLCTLAAPGAHAAVITQTRHFELSISEVSGNPEVLDSGGFFTSFFQDSALLRFNGLDPALGVLTSITRTLDVRIQGEIGASVRGPGAAAQRSLNIFSNFSTFVLASDVERFSQRIPIDFLRVICDEPPFLCLGRLPFSRDIQDTLKLSLSDNPEVALFNVAAEIEQTPSLNLALQRNFSDTSADQSTRFGFSVESALTGDLILTYEFTPATVAGPTLPEPSSPWLLGIGFLVLAATLRRPASYF